MFSIVAKLSSYLLVPASSSNKRYVNTTCEDKEKCVLLAIKVTNIYRYQTV